MASKTDNRICPKCGMDVVEAGFETQGVVNTTWQKICGELSEIATAYLPHEVAFCLNCRAQLKVKPSELLELRSAA